MIYADWVSRFKERLVIKGGVDSEYIDGILEAELDNWQENQNEWQDWTPEDAADSNMSYWCE